MKRSSAFFSSLALTAILAAQVFPQNSVATTSNPAGSKEIANSKTSKAPVTVEKIEQDVSEVLTVIQENYVEGKKLDYNDLFKSSIDSMLHTLDPHSNYFDAKEFEQFRTEQQSQYFGIGATIGDLRDPAGNLIGTFIRATFDNAPANRAGLRYGDKIVEVNGTSVLGKAYPDVRKHLLGPRGTMAKLTVERYGTGKRETVEIIRDAVPQPAVSEAYMIRPGVGYIAMRGNFTQTIYNEFRRALRDLKSQGMEYLVLDLRENGGGLVNQAYQIANTFLSSGQTVFTQKGRLGGTTDTYRSENINPDKTPIVMLVNRNTASASEILAGALQDHDRALIVGEGTFGKGLVQNPFLIEYGSMLLLTIAKYETPSGRLIQRDYSDGNLYDYYTKGGISGASSDSSKAQPQQPKGKETKTDTGRVVYGGGGITPDVVVKAQTITTERFNHQAKIANAIFAFALDTTSGKVAGFENYQVDRPITFGYTLKSTDYQVTDALFQAFKKFAADKYKFTPAQIDREREFIEEALRSELVTAAYGTTTSYQVSNEYNTQLKKAIELLPRAKQLAQESERIKSQKASNEANR